MNNAEGKPLIRFSTDELRTTLGAQTDGYCHVDTPESICAGIASTNARPLSEVAEWLLKNTMQSHADKIKILFLGPGYGYECAQARHQFPNAHIATRSLSPINPLQLPLQRIEDLHGVVQTVIRDRTWQNSPEKQALAVQLNDCSDSYPPSLLMHIDAHLQQPVFFRDVKGNPFIDEQVIGRFPHEAPIQDCYHLLYDRYGPFHKMSVLTFLRELKNIQVHIHDKGALVVDTLPPAFSKHPRLSEIIHGSILEKNAGMFNEISMSLVVAAPQKIQELLDADADWSVWAWKYLREGK